MGCGHDGGSDRVVYRCAQGHPTGPACRARRSILWLGLGLWLHAGHPRWYISKHIHMHAMHAHAHLHTHSATIVPACCARMHIHSYYFINIGFLNIFCVQDSLPLLRPHQHQPPKQRVCCLRPMICARSRGASCTLRGSRSRWSDAAPS